VHGHVIVGTSGDSADVPHFLQAVDPASGKIIWRWRSLPEPGDAAAKTWPNPEAMRFGGGPLWVTGTYDPDLNLIYWGTGNPHPTLAGVGREGDNLFTCSIVALNPDTGKLVWYFQPSPHDTHDWDAVETPVLVDGSFHGVPTKMLMQASRNGYFFVLDRQTGKSLLTEKFVDVDWASGIDKQGRPIPNKAKEPQRDGALVRANMDGATNWMAPSFDPETQLFYVNAQDAFSIWYLGLTEEGKAEGHQGGTISNFWSSSALKAIDYQTGKIRWRHDLGEGRCFSGILTTAGKLLFSGDTSGNLIALDPATGETLWHVNAGGVMNSSPMTYSIDDRQYLLTGVDGVLYAWTLPSK